MRKQALVCSNVDFDVFLPLNEGNPEVEKFHLHLTTKDGARLEDEKTLAECDIKDGSFVNLELEERKGR